MARRGGTRGVGRTLHLTLPLLLAGGAARQPASSQLEPAVSAECAPASIDDKKWAPTTHTDEANGFTTIRSATAVLARDAWAGTHSTLTLEQVTLRSGFRSYQVVASYRDPEWLFIEPGESLVFFVDSVRIGLTGVGSAEHREEQRDPRGDRKVVRGDEKGLLADRRAVEIASYEIEPALIRTIADGRTITVRLIGSQREREYSFTRDASCAFRRFARDAVGRDSL